MNAQNKFCFKVSPTTRVYRASSSVTRYLSALIATVSCFTFVALHAAQADGRVALLLGAEKYQYFKPSGISSNQILALEAALKKQGFSVLTTIDPGNADARAALSDFSHKAETADFALIVATGHFATYRNQSFFLPVNTRVRRATDLFSRGLSAKNITDIASKAKAGALLMLVTVPDIPSTVAGISMRPDFSTPLSGKVIASFSSSDNVPVSRVNSVSVQAMKDLIEAAGETPMMLAALMDSASAGATGRVFGKASELNLSVDASKAADAAKAQAAQSAANEAERKARLQADTRIREAEARAREAEQRAIETEARAKREMAAATAAQKAMEASKAAEEKAAADANAARVATAPASSAPAASAPPTAPTAGANIASLQVVEALLGRGQRKVIQRLLKDMGHYDGPIDAIFGDQTRDAIRAFQKQSAAPETGYLTPTQFQKLIASK